MRQGGFTLIELLVAVIAILAAIALPNSLEAQLRAKIARVRSDFRAAAAGLEAYAVDFNQYPPIQHWSYLIATLEMPGSSITTPVAYLTSVPRRDPLGASNWMGNNPEGLFQYFSYMPSRRTGSGSPATRLTGRGASSAGDQTWFRARASTWSIRRPGTRPSERCPSSSTPPMALPAREIRCGSAGRRRVPVRGGCDP